MNTSSLRSCARMNERGVTTPNDDDSSIEPDSQESLIESILECDECISNLDSIHVHQRKLLDSTLLDANRIGKH